ncbi:MAG: DUF2723 domain-containing protein [Vulcanimicrobiota bacterium]
MKLVAPVVAVLALILYVYTAAPSVGPGHDSGELTVAAYCLGVAHPPGYPLYVRLAHAWGGMLGGDYGWRINLFSGACTALAAGFLADLMRLATRSGPAAALTGLGFALLGSVWRQSVIAEVFALNFAIIAALGWLGWRALEHPRWLWPFYATLGLGLAHHHTFVLALPGLLWMAWPHWRRVLFTPAWLLAFIIPILFYADLWWRALHQPSLNWGGLQTLQNVVDHFLRRSYGTFRLSTRPDGLDHGVLHGLAFVLFTYGRQAPALWMLAASWGGLVGHRVEARLWRLAWGWLLAFGPFFALIGRQQLDDFHLDLLERFYASSYLGLALLAGLGAIHLGRRLGGWLWLPVTGLLAWQLWLNLPTCRLDGRELMASYARLLLDNCPSQSLLVVSGDLPVGALSYVQVVEGYRSEVPVVCSGLFGGRWYRQALPQWVQPVLPTCSNVTDLAEACDKAGLPVFTNQQNVPEGPARPRRLLWQWRAPIDPSRAAEVASLRAVLVDAQSLRPGLGQEGRFWPLYLISARLASLRLLSGAVYQDHPRLALQALDLLLELGQARPLDHLNRGLLRQRLGRHRLALQDFEKSLELDPSLELARVAQVYSQTCLSLSQLNW